MIEVCNLIENNRIKICNNVIKYAKLTNLIDLFKGGTDIWENPVDDISKYIILILKSRYLQETNSQNIDYIFLLICQSGIGNILKYHNRKIDSGGFLAAVKCYRRAYIDLIFQCDLCNEDKVKDIYRLERIFDKLEISACSEWNKTSNSEIKFNTLAEITSAIILIHDFKKFNYVNYNMEKLTGYTNDEILQMNFEDLIHPSFRKTAKKYLSSQYLFNSAPPTHELKIITKDGTERWLEFSHGYIFFANKPLMLGIAFDITARKKTLEENIKLQQTIEYDKMRNEFLANLSHEFRTPLNVILSSIQLLEFLEDKNKDSIIKYTNIMKQNCYRLTRLVNNLLDITRIDAGHTSLYLKKANIIDFIENVTLSVIEYTQKNDINLIFDTTVEEKIMTFDSRKLERILLNLLSNSVKFTNPGGSIYITAYDKKKSVLISVKDTGMGIPKENRKNIFEKFIQVDKSLSRNREGSGIGLFLVKSLVEIHKGKIFLTSECDKGSEFLIEIPDLSHLEESESVIIDNSIEEDFLHKAHIEFSDIYY
ncbi:PAS domain-containing sensor histidine kinase [Clostridium sp. ZS2-4]|uniref:PAS domain-containing sensor histidine kinase n=1 Tax=Clostridium sp. ZS2-4 TaxID=2987703 RepID=UPI00227A4AF7|nr:PAS domain-containing sensor histidine kinase [Clostridium sp. ZS2-4]MCY6355825.1 PAS domain-containing sensor histidine kinase [Clostridium sp. ZS2-4]